MPEFLAQRFRGIQRIFMFIGLIVLMGVLSWYSWPWGLVGFLFLGILLVIHYQREKTFQSQMEAYISTLTHRVKKAGQDVLSGLPVGVLIYDESDTIQWHNPYVLSLLEQEQEESLVGLQLAQAFPAVGAWLEEDQGEGAVYEGNCAFYVMADRAERVLYIFDQTGYRRLQHEFRQGQPVFMYIHLDNLEEVTQGMDEQRFNRLMSDVTQTISSWARKRGIYLRRTSADKFFGVLDEQTLEEVQNSKFDLIDHVRELTGESKLPITLSIGVGAGADSLLELGEFAQSSLDIVLGRGGDQAAVKRGAQRITFYGGKSDAVEKRTRVRARVISHALRNVIEASDQVLIMGHQSPDMDAIGAGIGILRAAKESDIPGYIVLDPKEQHYGIQRLMEKVKEEEQLFQHFIHPQKALELKTDKSLLIVVDVHKPSMVQEPRLVDHLSRRVVIDHHRRGEEFIPDPLLVYMEPYASSTSELVTELLEYYKDDVQLTSLEATSLLTGIFVDTKGFSLRTGTRTFDAASYLRLHGANSVLVQTLLKEDKEQFVQRTKIVAGAEYYGDKVAISVADGQEVENPIILAQAADTLLTLEGVMASFVISEREPGMIHINARSLGTINVQMIMEKMEGGGHLTHAATKLSDKEVGEVVQWLKEVLDESLEGGTKS